jgi:hypothetical protein
MDLTVADPLIGRPEQERMVVNARFSGQIITTTYVRSLIFQSCLIAGPFMSNLQFLGCEFRGCAFDEVIMRHCKFYSCRFVDCVFRRSGILSAEMEECTISGLLAEGGKPFRPSNLRMRDCIFENQDLRHFELGQVVCEGLTLTRVSGLETLVGQQVPRSARPADDHIVEPHLEWKDRYLNWELLRTTGRLPLFGLSYSALLGIPALLWLLAFYNDHVEAVRAALLVVPGPWRSSALELAAHVGPIRPPGASFWFFLGTLGIAFGSTVFALACPDRIKEFTRREWLDQLNGSVLGYDPISLSRRWARLACALAFAVGLVLTLSVIATKIVHAGAYIWEHGGRPWPF